VYNAVNIVLLRGKVNSILKGKGMEGILFRKADVADIPRLVELRLQQLQEEGAESTIDLSTDLTEYFEKNIQNGSFISWLAIYKGNIIATSGMTFIQRPPYYENPTGYVGILSGMYTLEPYRREGIARRLLGLVVDEAKEYGCGLVQITASDMGMHLYHNFGFQEHHKFMRYKLK